MYKLKAKHCCIYIYCKGKVFLSLCDRVVYEGPGCEYEADRMASEEDVQYYFRVAAVNDVGIGPYSVSVCYTKEKACELHT